MNRSSIFLVVVGLVVGAIVTPQAMALATSLAELKNCDNVTVGASQAVSTATCVSGTGSSLIIQNESASCIRVGGSGVTASTGIQVGDGCAAGQVVSIDARRAWMISESGDVTGVDVAWGEQ